MNDGTPIEIYGAVLYEDGSRSLPRQILGLDRNLIPSPLSWGIVFPFNRTEVVGLTFNTLREVNVTRCRRWHPPESTPWTAADWSNAMCGEAGEYANIIKKIRRHETGAANEGDPPVEELKRKAARELADVVIYADLNASYLGIDLGEAIREKFNQKSVEYGFPERL